MLGLPNIDGIIVATNPTVGGEATATYPAQQLRRAGVKVHRHRHGHPRRQRHRVYRRNHHAQGHGRPAGDLEIGDRLRYDLEHRPTVIEAAVVCRTVQIPETIKRQTGLGQISIPNAVREIVQNFFCPRPARRS